MKLSPRILRLAACAALCSLSGCEPNFSREGAAARAGETEIEKQRRVTLTIAGIALISAVMEKQGATANQQRAVDLVHQSHAGLFAKLELERKERDRLRKTAIGATGWDPVRLLGATLGAIFEIRNHGLNIGLKFDEVEKEKKEVENDLLLLALSVSLNEKKSAPAASPAPSPPKRLSIETERFAAAVEKRSVTHQQRQRIRLEARIAYEQAYPGFPFPEILSDPTNQPLPIPPANTTPAGSNLPPPPRKPVRMPRGGDGLPPGAVKLRNA